MESVAGASLHGPWHLQNMHLVSVLLVSLLAPAVADILVVNLETNETSPIFEDLTAGFGPRFPHRGLLGRIVYAEPADACGPVQAPPGPREGEIGWIMVISRSKNCHFADKVLAAQQKGYDAAIIHNYEGHEARVKMDGNENGSFVNIPSSFVGWQEGMRLKDEYNYRYKKYYIRVLEDDDINYKLYLWPFAIVVAVCFILVMVFVIVKFVREHASRRLNRLSRKHLKKIPVRKYKKGDYYDTCAICLDEYEEGEKIRVLPCDHVYHTKCIDPWLTKNKKTCPVCKRRVMPGRDADDEGDSDVEDGTVTSENTPLLRDGSGNSGSTSPGVRAVPQYSASSSINSSGNEEGLLPASVSPQLSCSQQSASAFISTDGSGQVFLSQPGQSRGRPGSEANFVPTDSDGVQGAVGGAGISDQFCPAIESTDAEAATGRDSGREKRRRGEERRRDGAPGAEETVTETRDERRERRRKKKEKRKRVAELARRAMVSAAEEADKDWLSREALHDVDVAGEGQSEQPASGAGQGALVLSSSDSAEPTSRDVTEEEGKKEKAEEKNDSYINPSYSESDEVSLPNPSRRHEMNDMV